TEVPMMPGCVRGVINLRGAVVPVMDLAARFGKPATAVTKRTCIVIVEVEAGGERQDMGVVVDAVNAVLEIPAADIEPAPAFGARIRTDFIEGMGKIDGKFVILLNVNQVLSAEEIGALAQGADMAALLPAA
ncbi:MAG TPA: chemotaxis protein CheW, partial [Noviherbaspirillum sp.]